MTHISMRSFKFLIGQLTFFQAQDAVWDPQLKNQAACGVQTDWTLKPKEMMWVHPNKDPHQGYGEKVTCKKCIKLLKERGL